MTFNEIITQTVRALGPSVGAVLDYEITFGAANLATEDVVVDTFAKTIDFKPGAEGKRVSDTTLLVVR